MNDDLPNKYGEIVYRFKDPEFEGDFTEFRFSEVKDDETIIVVSDGNRESQAFISFNDLGNLFFALKRYLNA